MVKLKLNHWLLVAVVFLLAVGCASEKKDWKNTKSENNKLAYKNFLKRHSQGSFADSARLCLEELYFRQAQSTNTILAYKNFLKQHSQGSFADSARSCIEDIEEFYFKQAQSTNSIPAYEYFLYRHSQGSFADSARLCIEKLHFKRVKEQIERLYSSDAVERGYGAYCLGNMRERAAPAVHFLIGILDDNTPLEWKDSPFTRAFGAPDLTSPGEEARCALGKIGKPAVEPLIAALNDDNSDIRIRAAGALGELRDPRAVEPLIAALNDEDPFVRGSATIALGKIKDLRSVEPLIAALKDKSTDVREYAAKTLGEIQDSRAVKPLIAALKDEYWIVRMSAVKALGKIKDPSALVPLITALKDEKEWVREDAAEALEKITGEDFGIDYDKWMNWWNQNK